MSWGKSGQSIKHLGDDSSGEESQGGARVSSEEGWTGEHQSGCEFAPCHQAMSVLQAAKNKDWAAVLLRAQAGPSLTRTLQTATPFVELVLDGQLQDHFRPTFVFGACVAMCPHQVPLTSPLDEPIPDHQTPSLLGEVLSPLGLDARGPLVIFRTKTGPLEWSSRGLPAEAAM